MSNSTRTYELKHWILERNAEGLERGQKPRLLAGGHLFFPVRGDYGLEDECCTNNTIRLQIAKNLLRHVEVSDDVEPIDRREAKRMLDAMACRNALRSL